MRYLVLVILCGWYAGWNSTLHTGQNNKYQVLHK